MKKSFNLLLIMLMFFISCTTDSTQETAILDKKHSVEYKRNNYFLNNDGSVSKFSNNVKNYNIYSEMPLEGNLFISKNLNTSSVGSFIFRITHTETNEYIDLHNFVEYDEYYTFEVLTSTGVNLTGFKFYDKSLINITNLDKNSNQTFACPLCPILVPVIVKAVIEALQDTDMEQCRKSMPKTCPEGKAPYMEFSEGLFFTTCNVGCR